MKRIVIVNFLLLVCVYAYSQNANSVAFIDKKADSRKLILSKKDMNFMFFGLAAGLDFSEATTLSGGATLLFNIANGQRNVCLAELSYHSPRFTLDTLNMKVPSVMLETRLQRYFGIFGEYSTGFYIGAAPYFAYNLKAKVLNVRTSSFPTSSLPLNKFDLGLRGSFGFTLFVLASFEYNYKLGFIPILKGKNSGQNVHSITFRMIMPW